MLRFEQWLVQVNRTLIALMLAIVFAIVFVNVVLRYGFGTSLAWVEESARFLMIGVTFLGAGLALREGRLVAIDMLQDRLPAPLRTALRLAIALLMLVFMAALVWFGSRFVAFGWNKETMATQIPRGVPYLAIPVGAGLFIVHLLLFLRRFVSGTFEDEVSDDATPIDPAVH
jgi:TRAP-type transport system small permease protein